MKHSPAVRMLSQVQHFGIHKTVNVGKNGSVFFGDRELIIPFQAGPQILSGRSPLERNAGNLFVCAECAGYSAVGAGACPAFCARAALRGDAANAGPGGK